MSLSITEKIFKALNNINNYNIPYYEFDLVLSGGGCSGYYYAGTFEIIKHLEKANKIKINKIYATSAGVLAGIFYLCNIGAIKWFESYNDVMNTYKNNNNFHLSIINTLRLYLPENAHELCNNKLNIVVSRLTIFGFKKEIFNKFNTLDDLILIVSASFNVPFILSNHYGGIKIGPYRYYDGLFTCNTPIQYNSQYPQLVMKTHKVEYPLKYIFNVNDECIQLLLIRGYIETDKFLNNDTQHKNLPFIWINKNLDKKENEKNKHKNKSFYFVNLTIMSLYILLTYKK